MGAVNNAIVTLICCSLIPVFSVSAQTVEGVTSQKDRCLRKLEKIESDLHNAQAGNQCPKCIASNVNLFCRQIESIDDENSNLTGDIADFERSLRRSASISELVKRTDRSIAAAAIAYAGRKE